MKHIGGDNEREYMTTQGERTATQRRIQLGLMKRRELESLVLQLEEQIRALKKD